MTKKVESKKSSLELPLYVETYINESKELIHVFVEGEEIITTPTHPFYSPTRGWMEAIELRAGDILVLVNGEYVIIEKVQHEILESPVTVYNFQVEDYHTYYVGDTSVLVHNMCAKKAGIKKVKYTAKEFVRSPKNAKEVLSYLQDLGFEIDRQKGSYIQLVKGFKLVTVPMHGSEDINIKTLRSIMKQGKR